MNPIERIPYTHCPLCEGIDFSEEMQGPCTSSLRYRPEMSPIIRWMTCHRCSHVFVDGYFGDEASKLVFEWQCQSQLPGQSTVDGRAISAKIIENVSQVRGAWRGKWLDVGFGNGALLATAKEFGYDVVGIDLQKNCVELMQKFGVEAYHIELSKLHLSAFNVVSMADVLEHMPYPRQALLDVNRLTVERGALFVSMPNTESFVWQQLDRQRCNPYWGEIEHLHNFSRSRLYGLLEECGFEPVRYSISQRYVACMEVIAIKKWDVT